MSQAAMNFASDEDSKKIWPISPSWPLKWIYLGLVTPIFFLYLTSYSVHGCHMLHPVNLRSKWYSSCVSKNNWKRGWSSHKRKEGLGLVSKCSPSSDSEHTIPFWLGVHDFGNFWLREGQKFYFWFMVNFLNSPKKKADVWLNTWSKWYSTSK